MGFRKNKAPLKPREELTIEFSEYSNEQFVLMSRNNFIDYISEINQIIIKNKTQIEMNANEIILNLISELIGKIYYMKVVFLLPKS